MAGVCCLLLLILAHTGVGDDAGVTQAIPFDKLSEESRRLVRNVTDQPTFALGVGPRSLQGDQGIFEYLLDHLEVCALAGRRLNVATFTTRREKDGRIFGDDGETSTGYLTFVHVGDGKRVFHVEGMQKGLFTVGGHSVVALEFGKPKNAGSVSREAVDYRMQVWVKVDSAFFAFLSRVFLTKSQNTADRQFTRLLGVPVGVTQRIHDDPKAVLDVFDSLNETDRVSLKELRARIESLNPQSSQASTR